MSVCGIGCVMPTLIVPALTLVLWGPLGPLLAVAVAVFAASASLRALRWLPLPASSRLHR